MRLATMVLAVVLACGQAMGAEARLTIPFITGRPGVQAFAGHPGWVDAYRPGKGLPASARISADGRFNLPDTGGPATLIFMFDKIETPPFVVTDFVGKDGEVVDVPIPAEYVCVPPGFPETWDKQYLHRAHHYLQTFVPRCTQIYGVTIFDGPKIVSWGNKLNAVLYDGPFGKPIILPNHDGTYTLDFLSANHSDKDLGRVGFRHGDYEVMPGKPYAMCIGGYNSHGGEYLDLPAYVRPDNGDGYADGDVVTEKAHTGQKTAIKGDLCGLIFGNGHGQLVENQIRTEEWEIFIPHLPPTKNWGQSFTNHGKSLAGISFWANNGSSKAFGCEIRIRQDNAGGDLLKVVKWSQAHDSPLRPVIRYADWHRPYPGAESYWKLPADLLQVSFAPGEVPLEKGKMYFIEMSFSEPVVCYADGDCYDHGYAYYEDLKMEKARYSNTKHSQRWTLAVNVVTYEK